MNMSDINVLVTGAGAPGIMGTIYSLKKNWDNRRIRIVGVDMNPNAVGKYFCDEFYRVPEGTSQSFPLALLDICKKEKIDVVLPQVTEELLLLSKWKKEFETEGIAIAISDEKSIVLANNKYELMRISKKLGIPTPKFMIVKSKNELLEAFEEFGEKLMLTNSYFFKKLATSESLHPVINCKLLTHKNKVKLEGLLVGMNIRIIKYYRDLLKEEKNAIFLSYSVFEEHKIKEGEPATIIKDITTSSKIFF